MHIQFAVNLLQIPADGAHAENQLLGDFAAVEAVAQKVQDVQFAGGEGINHGLAGSLPRLSHVRVVHLLRKRRFHGCGAALQRVGDSRFQCHRLPGCPGCRESRLTEVGAGSGYVTIKGDPISGIQITLAFE